MDNLHCVDKAALTSRKNMYDFFTRVFQAEIDAEFIDSLQSIAANIDENLDHVLASYNTQEASVVAKELACDYSRLFLGMSAHPVPPYESVFLSENHLLMQEQRDEMVALYRAEGMDIGEDFKLPEDHLAAELSFMSHVCGKSLRAIEQNDTHEFARLEQVQRQVLELHLKRWVPLFAQQVAQQESIYRTEPSFYAAIAKMLDTFIASEVAYL